MGALSYLLPGGGAAACLASLWWLAGLGESSPARLSPRAAAAGAVGLVGLAAAHFQAPPPLREALLLTGLFALVSVVAVVAGACKLEAALAASKQGLALRRASGLVGGTFLGLSGVAAACLSVALSSVTAARLGWLHALPLVGASLVVLVGRAALVGAAVLAFGRRLPLLAFVSVLLLLSARHALPWPVTLAAERGERVPPAIASPPSVAAAPAPELPAPAEPPSVLAPEPAAPSGVSSAAPAPSAPAPDGAAPGAASAAGIRIVSLEPQRMLEADARGGVSRRMTELDACVTAGTRATGTLALNVLIDENGSVHQANPKAGELLGSPIAACFLPQFYRMSFAAPRSGAASFKITLSVD